MSRKPRVLIVDPDSSLRRDLEQVLSAEGLDVRFVGDASSARQVLSDETPDAVVTELTLPDGSGLEIVRRSLECRPEPVVLVLASYPDTREIIEAIRHGALDVLEKPLAPERILTRLLPALEERGQPPRFETTPAKSLARPPIVGTSPCLRAVLERVARVAATPNTTVLIQGESGTGKELVARAVHYDGHRQRRAFMAINCAALNETILEAELFGYEKGAFTGASSQGKKGLFEAADGGTVFLDEIGEMSVGLQAKLLRVLEDGTFKRVGGVNDVRVDVRIIAATNRDLWAEAEAGRFRKDLYFRLHVMPIPVPALRERRDDILELAHHFLSHFARTHGKDVRGFASAAERRLLEHAWPGNVRELRNVCEYAVIVCDGPIIEVRHLAIHEGRPPLQASADLPLGEDLDDDLTLLESSASLTRPGVPTLPLEDLSLRSMEIQLIRHVLAETRYNVTRAARKLGINRSTLYNKMRDYGLARDDSERRPLEHSA